LANVTLAAVRKGCYVCALAAVAFLVAASAPRVAPARAAAAACAGVPDGSSQTAPSPGAPCWVATDPYPFGVDGNPVDPTTPLCSVTPQACYLTVTSMAFRAWNRGLAATPGGSKNPFGVWLYNGTRWYPDPTFPGTGVCQGNTVLWAGKLDYWLIGTGVNGWAPLCRFDGSNFLWETLPMPLGTIERLGDPITKQLPIHGGITSGSCLSWDNCWFFGTDGTVLHWDGQVLTDVSPGSPAASAGTTFTTAQLNAGANGSPIGLATVGTSYGFDVSAGIPLPTRASLPTQLLSFDGTMPDGRRLAGNLLTPINYRAPAAAQPTNPAANDPYGTDPVALSLDASGRAWLAANPAGWQAGADAPFVRPDLDAPERSPLVPLSTGPGSATGPDPNCPAWSTPSALDQFPHTYPTLTAGSTLWTSISAFPGGRSALAGGQAYSTLSDGSIVSEPLLVQANCDGTTSVTRFRIPPQTGSTTPTPADESGWIEGVAANAPNDGWAATSSGNLPTGVSYQPPELYHYTDGTPPKAPAGNDDETRSLPSNPDPPIYVYHNPPPPKLPPIPVAAKTQNLPPAISGLHRRIQRGSGTYTLILSFTVHRRVDMGVNAYRRGQLVASTGLRSLTPPSGQLRLALNPKRWPTKLAFITDAPRVALASPGRLTGTVALSATAKPVAGRTIKSIQFQYALAGSGYWIVIGTAKRKPFRLPFDTTTVANGTYDLRAVARDSRGRTGISRVIASRGLKNAGH
jgi:hypothetical protein